MVKLDEWARVPPVDGPARRRLAVALDVDGVVSVSLMGSQATGRAGPLSDVDVGVWVRADLDHATLTGLSDRLRAAAERALGTTAVDLLILNAAPPLLQHRALRDGRRLLERDHDERVRLETRALLGYLDTAPLRATLTAGLRRRLAEDRFGRR